MTKDRDHMSWDKREYEQLEEEMQTLLQSPVPLDPSFKQKLRAELLREHRRLYGEKRFFKRRFPLGIASGTAAALLLLSTTVYLAQGDRPLNQTGLDDSKKDLVWDQPAKEQGVAKNGGSAMDKGSTNHPPASETADPKAAFPDDQQLAMDDHSDASLHTGNEVRKEGLSAPASDGHAISTPPSQADDPPASNEHGISSDSEKKPSLSEDEPANKSWEREVPVDREFVFSLSTITMSNVVPFRTENALPSNIRLKASWEALPREKQVYTFANQLPYDIQRRQRLPRHWDWATTKRRRHGDSGTAARMARSYCSAQMVCRKWNIPTGGR